ncbi:MAG TPA: DNA gyrase subunit A [Dongiaceae bacterium]|nr:DNA gyrase subunit A [Dongiaceae bacterium]
MTEAKAPGASDIAPVTIEEEMRRSYLDYAMSVIVSRALPDVRDGLKPVHRRILYAMREGGYESAKPHRKSARIVGDVIGKYHPHGDQSVYDAIVRMAQDFSMRLVLVDGQGNFGSMDDDPAAAMRYTEVRLTKAAETLLEDLDSETVDFQANYDESLEEPTVLPARFPNLLVNGAGGIAVGMATNIPTHNLTEVLNACIATIDNPEITAEALLQILPGPDFPTGGIILGTGGIRSAYATGRGSITVRARTSIEEIRKDREAIIVTEIPYQVNKKTLIERIAELVREKQIEGISDLRDESDREGVRIVIELKREAMAEIVLNQLYRFTAMQTNFGVNMLALNGGRPELLNLKQILNAFIEFREQVITRRTMYELGRTRDRAHVLVGLAIAVVNIDEVIALIRAAPDGNIAKEGLMARSWSAEMVAPLIELIDDPSHRVASDNTYRLSETQAKAILDLRLQRLTGLEREKIADELEELSKVIADCLDILESRARRIEIMKREWTAIRDAHGGARRTAIEETEFAHDIEDLIQREDMVITVTHGGYIKRVPLSTYRAQKRGGKGRAGMTTKDEDFVNQVFIADTLTPVLFFSSRGMVYKSKVYKLPLGNPQARGKALVNLLPLAPGETISTIMPLRGEETEWSKQHVVFATSVGDVRRNELSDFIDVRTNGKIAMKLGEGESLVGVAICSEAQDILLAAHSGKAIRFPVSDIRVFAGRNSTGVRGIRLAPGDRVVSLSVLHHIEASPEERTAYLRYAANKRRMSDGEALAPESTEDGPLIDLPQERIIAMEAAEEFILTVTENGYGKRSSAYEYRITRRGGQGIENILTNERNGMVVASFPIAADDQVMMVTDGGQLIRFPVDDIRIAGRRTQGVTLFKVEEEERVVAVAHVNELGEDNGEEGSVEEEDGTSEPDGEAGL